jgi:hypothetical protein
MALVFCLLLRCALSLTWLAPGFGPFAQFVGVTSFALLVDAGTPIPITLTCVGIEQPPYSLLSTSSGLTTASGLYPILYDAILKEAGYAPSITYYPSPDGSSGSLVNGIWTGGVGEMVAGRANCFCGSLSISQSRFNVLQFTTPFRENRLAVLTKTGASTFTVWAFFLPFSWEVWIVLLSTGFFMAIAMYVVDRWSPFGSYRSKEPHERLKAAPRELLFQSFLILVANNRGGETTRGTPGRILAWFYSFFTLIMIATYTASLASVFVLTAGPPVIGSVSDLRLAGLPFATVANSNAAQFFTQPSYATALVNMETVPDFLTGVNGVRSGQFAGFVSTIDTLVYYANQPPCSTIVIGQSDVIGPVMIGFAFTNQSSQFLNDVSLATLRLMQNGVFMALWDRTLYELQNRGCSGQASQTNQVSLYQLQGLWFVLLMGLGLALLALAVERVFVYLLRRHRSLEGIADAAIGPAAVGLAGEQQRGEQQRPARAVSMHVGRFLGTSDGLMDLVEKERTHDFELAAAAGGAWEVAGADAGSGGSIVPQAGQ